MRSSILNWMIEGRDRLFKNKGFSLTKTQEEMIVRFKRASDNVGSFLAEMIVYDKDSFTPKITASNAYKDYCEDMGLEAETPAKFNARLRASSKIKETSTRIGIGKDRKKVKCWLGFRLIKVEPVEPLFTSEENHSSENLGDKKTVPTVPTVLARNCGQCEHFRKQSCRSADNWQFRSGNAQPYDKYCFTLRQEASYEVS